MSFDTVLNNLSLALASGGYTTGSGTLALRGGDGAGITARLSAEGQPPISASAPVRFTVARSNTQYFVFKATALSGDTLTGTVVEGTDQNFPGGTTVEARWTAGLVRQITSGVVLPAGNNSAGTFVPTDAAYGAKGDGVTDDGTALLACLNAANAAGGTVLLPPGKVFKFSQPLVLDNFKLVELRGSSGPEGLGLTTANASLLYTGTGTSAAISLKGSQGVSLRNFVLFYTQPTASFTGGIVDASGNTNDTTGLIVEHCQFQGSDASHSGAAFGVKLNHAINCRVSDCLFAYMAVGVRGADVGGYSNVVTLRKNRYLHLTTAATQNAGQSWLFDTETWEPLQSGAAGGYQDAGGWIPGGPNTFLNCWGGDATATGGFWITYTGNGLKVDSCQMTAAVGANEACISLGSAAGAVQGVKIVGGFYTASYVVNVPAGAANIFGLNVDTVARTGGWFLDPGGAIRNPTYLTRDSGNNQIGTPLILPSVATLGQITAIPTGSSTGLIGNAFVAGPTSGSLLIVAPGDGGGGNKTVELWGGDGTPTRGLGVGYHVYVYKDMILAPTTSTQNHALYADSSNGDHITYIDGSGAKHDLQAGGSGTVTSVGLTVPSWLGVSGSPVTTSGTLAVTAAAAAANNFLAGPASGAAAAPAFRALAAADVPSLDASKVGSGTLAAARIPDLSASYLPLAGGGTVTGTVTVNAANKHCFHLSRDATDTGGYLDSDGASAFYASGGAQYSTYTTDYVFVSKYISACGFIFEGGNCTLWSDSSLTAGLTFTPTYRWGVDNFGNVSHYAKSSTGANRAVGRAKPGYADPTDATRKGRLIRYSVDAGGDRETAREWSDGANGRVALSAPASAPADADLANSQVSFYLDEVGGNLKVRVKYSNGTLKTGTVTLS